ncbi:hypothetical protein AYL99_11762 [Fonsecaea erecta]|uniref:F-box domain-containing protein n=1 Tax=Fonsecaea erecta TaxID=1367422 RepID=A0A178Z2K5_9EURO|nr:hypothetical protein AYL99_11762 [Fonsecaea erecta]OAP54002.1 hypothetical protein AYL99_11762 [Fonsecaea erecta]
MKSKQSPKPALVAPRRSARLAGIANPPNYKVTKTSKKQAKPFTRKGKHGTHQGVNVTKDQMKESVEPMDMSPVSALELPSEVWQTIVGYVDDTDAPGDLRNLRSTCKRVSELCEPAFCETLHGNALATHELILAKHQERQDLVQRFITHRQHLLDRSWVQMFTCIPRLRNLKVLHQSAFTELRECTLSPVDYHPIRVAHVLKAPKLTSLTVAHPLLDEQGERLPAPGSLPLKHLTLLVNPRKALQTVLSLLKLPKALETLSFDDSRAPMVRAGEGILHEVLPTLAEYQGNLTTLKVFATTPQVLSEDSLNGLLDFTVLKRLKVLSFCGHDNYPVNCFFKLPEGLRSLRFNGMLAMSSLTEKLLSQSSAPGFTCPRHVDVNIDYNVFEDFMFDGGLLLRPLSKNGQEDLDRHLHGINLFMTNLPCEQFTWVERFCSIERQLQATKTGSEAMPPYAYVLREEIREVSFERDDRVNRYGHNDLSLFHGCCAHHYRNF